MNAAFFNRCDQHRHAMSTTKNALANEFVHLLVFAKLAHIWTHDDQCAIVLTATRVTITKYSGHCSVRFLVTEFSVWYERAEP